MERDKLNLRNHTGATERYQVKPVMEKCPLRVEPIDSSDEPHCYFTGNRCTNDIQETCLAFGGILAAGWRPPLPEGELAETISKATVELGQRYYSGEGESNEALFLARAIMEKQKGE